MLGLLEALKANYTTYTNALRHRLAELLLAAWCSNEAVN